MVHEPSRSLTDIRLEIATDDFRRALFRLERHFNPNWPLQPRLPRGLGQRVSGTWTDGDGLVIPASTEHHHAPDARGCAVRRSPSTTVSPEAASALVGTRTERERIRRIGRVAPPTPRRPDHPFVWFHSDSELKRYLGSAGEGRSWHHIVEQRLADNGRFPPEWIHNTDNVINIPDILHQCINAEMSKIKPDTGGLTVRQWLEPQSFEFQYDYGVELIEKCVEKVGS